MNANKGKWFKRISWVGSLLFGLISIVWILIRVIPKPDRLNYPCMKVAFPFATTVVLYFMGVFASIALFKKAHLSFKKSNIAFASLLVAFGLLAFGFSMVQLKQDVFANNQTINRFSDPLVPNTPIGKAKGVFPGRVVWIHNDSATEPNCVPYEYGDGYFLDKNCNQAVVDKMLSEGLLQLTESNSQEDAWDLVFKYFNENHEKGQVGYVSGEKVFIKMNAVHAWTTNSDLSIKDDDNYGYVDTSPQVIMALLRQLVNKAGVPQDAIYIGDPYTNIFKHCYDKWSAEFPDVHYMSQRTKPNREKLSMTNTEQITYSDKGTVLDKETDTYYDCIVNADYILSVPAIKGHRWAGVTFFAKNHFGSNTSDGASHLHPGLHRIDYNKPMRDEYNSYRVFVDIMGYKHLGGKSLLYIGDLLWGTSYEHDPPVKFQTWPFNNDWSESLLLSFDPVAIASVSLDILQAEFQEEDLTVYPPRYDYVHFGAVDDYLHQAASSDWWPKGIVYDPNNTGDSLPSLGVHEHWNNALDMQYSRNLGSGEGIELVFETNASEATTINETIKEKNYQVVPTVMDESFTLISSRNGNEGIGMSIYTLNGSCVRTFIGDANTHYSVSDLPSGTYVLRINNENYEQSDVIIIK